MEEKQKKSAPNLVLAIVCVVLIIFFAVLFAVCAISYNRSEDKPVKPAEKTNVANTVVEEPEEDEELLLTEEEFPKVNGATAMQPLIGEITKTVLGYSEEQAQSFLDNLEPGKTAKVYEGLINKSLDLIFVSEPSDAILEDAKNAGVEFDMTGIGYDGFVFLVSKDNPVESLTLDQIRDIYAGKITNWKEVGGEDAEIIPLQREANSGSQNLMEKMVMKGTEMAAAKSPDYQIGSMSGLIDAVSNGENCKYTLGYSIYLYAKEQYVRDNVKFLKIDGIEVSDENITNKSYPLTKVVYAVMRKDEPEDSNARKLVDFLLNTEKGQETVVAGGYVRMK